MALSAEQHRPLAILFQQREDQPAPVPAAIMVGHGVERLLPRRAGRDRRAAESGLHHEPVRPHAIRHQRSADMGALAGSFAPVERTDDRAEQGECGGMIAHAGQRSRRRAGVVRPHEVHHARARPPGIAVEAGLVRLLAVLAVAGEGCVDEPLVERREIPVGDAEAPAHGRRKIGDEDVGARHHPVEHRLPVRFAQIERQALLVAGFQHPGPIVLGFGISRQLRQLPERISRRRLDLDHLRAEIGQDGGRRGRGDEARAIEHRQSLEDPLHSECSTAFLCQRGGSPYGPPGSSSWRI